LAAIVLIGPAATRFERIPRGPDLLREIAVHALQRRLGHPHPVVGGPRLAIVEVEPDEGAALVHQRQEGIGERLERVRRDVHGDCDIVPLRGEEVVAEAHLGCEPDRVDHAVDVSPLLRQFLADRHTVIGDRHVEFEDVDVVAELARRALGQRQRPPGSGEHDVGALVQCQLRHAVRQRGVGEHTGDHDLLAVEQTHVPDRR
jgi:hypothetical protein